MKPFATIQRVLTWFCICSEENTTKWQKFAHVIFTTFIGGFSLLGIFMSGLYGLKYISTDFEESLYAIYPLCGSLTGVYIIIVAGFSRRKINAIFETLSVIYETNAKNRFDTLNHKSTWFWQTYIKCVINSLLLNSVVLPAISILEEWRTQPNFDVDHLFHPYKSVLPWDQSTLPAYLVELLIIDVMAAGSYYIVVGILLALFISMCWHHRAFFEMFEHLLREFDCTNRRPHHLYGLIRFHTSVRSWFMESADAYSPFVLILLISSVMMLACSAFQVDLVLKHADSSIPVLLAAVVISIISLFTYCYFGKMATESHEQMSDALYECNWFEYPLKTQKYIWLMILNAQPPLYYHGFGVAVLNLETFCSLIRAVVTYFMAFKTLTE